MQKTLLLIDDEQSWLGVMSRLFKSCGYAVHTAASCRQGLEMASRHKADCVLLDFNLTDGTAADVSLQLRRSEALKTVPIIVVSGFEQAELYSYRECQADAFVLKDSGFNKILAVVESALRRQSWHSDTLEKGDLRLEEKTLTAACAGMSPVELSRDQFCVLGLLVRRSPEFTGYAEIASALRPSSPGEYNEEAVRALIYRLRKKLGARLASRIRQNSKRGWIYLQPRDRKNPPPAVAG